MFSREEKEFLVNVLNSINVKAMDPQAIIILGNVQTILTKLSKVTETPPEV